MLWPVDEVKGIMADLDRARNELCEHLESSHVQAVPALANQLKNTVRQLSEHTKDWDTALQQQQLRPDVQQEDRQLGDSCCTGAVQLNNTADDASAIPSCRQEASLIYIDFRNGARRPLSSEDEAPSPMEAARIQVHLRSVLKKNHQKQECRHTLRGLLRVDTNPTHRACTLGFLSVFSMLFSMQPSLRDYACDLSLIIPATWNLNLEDNTAMVTRLKEEIGRLPEEDRAPLLRDYIPQNTASISKAVSELLGCVPKRCLQFAAEALRNYHACHEESIVNAFAVYFSTRLSMVNPQRLEEQECPMITAPHLVELASIRAQHGGLLYKHGKDSPIARIIFDINGKTAIAVRSIDCSRLVSGRASNALYCAACAKVNTFLRKVKLKEKDVTAAQSEPRDSAALSAAVKKALKALPNSDSKELLCDLNQLIASAKLTTTSWLFKEMQHTVRVLSLEDLRAARYPAVMIAYWQCLRYLSGSRACRFRRGPVNEGAGNHGGRLPVDPSRFRSCEASISTLKNHMPPVVVYPPLAANANVIRASLEKSSRPLCCGISFDAFTIAAGYTPFPHLGVLVGAVSGDDGSSGAIPYNNLDKYTAAKLLNLAGQQVLQFFCTSADGTLSVPVGYVVQHGDSPEIAFSAIQEIVTKLDKVGIQTVFTSSDGWIGVDSYMTKLAKYSEKRVVEEKKAPISHIFDYTHLLKNLRNFLLNNGCRKGGTGEFFALKHLLDLRTAISALLGSDSDKLSEVGRTTLSALNSVITNPVINPSDKMAWAPVKALFGVQKRLNAAAALLPAEVSGPVSLLAEYFLNMKKIYNAFSFKHSATPYNKRLTALKEANLYFKSVLQPNVYATACTSHLQATYDSLTRLCDWQVSAGLWPDSAPLPWSFLSTLVVENFFSQIRAKHRFPSLALYATTYYSAYNYLVFTNWKDNPCPLGKPRGSKVSFPVNLSFLFLRYVFR